MLWKHPLYSCFFLLASLCASSHARVVVRLPLACLLFQPEPTKNPCMACARLGRAASLPSHTRSTSKGQPPVETRCEGGDRASPNIACPFPVGRPWPGAPAERAAPGPVAARQGGARPGISASQTVHPRGGEVDQHGTAAPNAVPRSRQGTPRTRRRTEAFGRARVARGIEPGGDPEQSLTNIVVNPLCCAP